MSNKKCSKCKIIQPSEEFFKHKNRPDGLQCQCKSCIKKYKEENKEKIIQRKKYYVRNKRLTDPLFKLKENLRTRCKAVIRAAKVNKSNGTLKLLGCTPEVLKMHLEAKFTDGMSWDNQGKWHIDHIRPCASFDLTDPEQQKQCFHYTNLQPLWASDNIKKGAKWRHQVNYED